MGLFDKLLNQVAEADREVFRRYPDLAKKVDQQDEYNTKWETWKQNHWDDSRQMTKNAVELIQQRDAEIEALKLLQGNDIMGWDEIKGNVQSLMEAQLKGQKVATEDSVKSYYEREVAPRFSIKAGDKEIPVTQYVQNLERGVEITYAQTGHLPLEYHNEFKDIQDAPRYTYDVLTKHMREKGIANFEDGYNSLVAPLRAKKAEAALKANEDKIRAEAKAEAKKEMAMSQGALPTDSQGSAQTALQMRIQDRAAKQAATQAPKLTPGTLGDGTAGRDAYSAYLKDQAAGQKPAWPIQ